MFSLPIALYLFICGYPPPILLSLFCFPPCSIFVVFSACASGCRWLQEGSSRRLYERAPVSKRPTTSQFTLRSQRSAPNSLTHTHCEHPPVCSPCLFSSFAKTLLCANIAPYSLFHFFKLFLGTIWDLVVSNSIWAELGLVGEFSSFRPFLFHIGHRFF